MTEIVPPAAAAQATTQETSPEMVARMECQAILAALLQRSQATLFASMSTVDGRSHAHAGSNLSSANAQRTAAITSSLMGLIESFSRETLASGALYNSIATDKGSIVIVRVPSRARLHTLCVCTDNTANLAMTIRAALDTAQKLAERIDAHR